MKKIKKFVVSFITLGILLSMSTTVFAAEPSPDVDSANKTGVVELDITSNLTRASSYKELSQARINGMFSGTETTCIAAGVTFDFRKLIPQNATVRAVLVTAENTGVANTTYDYKLLVGNQLNGINPIYYSVNMPKKGQYATFTNFNSQSASTPWYVSFSCKRLNTNQLTGATIKNVKLRIEYDY